MVCSGASKNTESQFGKYENEVIKTSVLKRSISSMIFVFKTPKQNLSSQFVDPDIESPLGGGTLAKFR